MHMLQMPPAVTEGVCPGRMQGPPRLCVGSAQAVWGVCQGCVGHPTSWDPNVLGADCGFPMCTCAVCVRLLRLWHLLSSQQAQRSTPQPLFAQKELPVSQGCLPNKQGTQICYRVSVPSQPVLTGSLPHLCSAGVVGVV